LTQDPTGEEKPIEGLRKASKIFSHPMHLWWGTTVKAMKNGKEVRLVVDSSGQIKEQN
jgi:hypothetical protein